jgi:hypothetical protein
MCIYTHTSTQTVAYTYIHIFIHADPGRDIKMCFLIHDYQHERVRDSLCTQRKCLRLSTKGRAKNSVYTDIFMCMYILSARKQNTYSKLEASQCVVYTCAKYAYI